MTFSRARALVMTTSQVPAVAPLAAFEVFDGVADGLFGVFAEGHEEGFDAPGQQELAEQRLVVGEGIDRDGRRAEGGERVGEKSRAGEDDDAGILEVLGECGGGRSILALGSLRRTVVLRPRSSVGSVLLMMFFITSMHSSGYKPVVVSPKASLHLRLAHGVGNIGNLRAGGHGSLGHRFQQVGGDDDGLSLGEASIDDAALDQGQDVVVDFDAEVAACDHDRVGGADDELEVAQAALVFDLGDDAAAGAEAVEERTEDEHVLAATDEGEGDEVDSGFDAGADIVFIFFGEGGEVHVNARQVDVPAGAQLAGGEDAAVDVGFGFVEDLEADQATVNQDGRADADISGETWVIYGNSADGIHGSGGVGGGIEIEGVSGAEIDGVFEVTGADFRALNIHHNGNVAFNLRGDLAHLFDEGFDPVAGCMGHVKAEDIDAGLDQLGKTLGSLGGRADGGDDLGVTVVAAHGFQPICAGWLGRECSMRSRR